MHSGIADGPGHVIGPFANGENLPVTVVEADVHPADHNGAVTSVAGDNRGPGHGLVTGAAIFVANGPLHAVQTVVKRLNGHSGFARAW